MPSLTGGHGLLRGLAQPGQAGREARSRRHGGDLLGLADRVHVGEFGQHLDAQSGLLEPGQLPRPGVRPGHRDAEDEAGIDLPQAEQPEAMPNVASAVLSTSGLAAAASNPGVTCGVSIPISTTGSGSVTRASTSAQAIRSSRPAPRCPITSNPLGSQRPGRPSSASTRRATVVSATAARVSDRDAAASSAAATGVNGGVSLVFTRPGYGSLAITTICAASRRLALLQAGAWAGTPGLPKAPSRRCLPV